VPERQRPAVDLDPKTAERENPDWPGPRLRRWRGRRDCELTNEPLRVGSLDLPLECSRQNCVLHVHNPAEVAIRQVAFALG
jgi:hypothetical protein